jgi:hypothetical protein
MDDPGIARHDHGSGEEPILVERRRDTEAPVDVPAPSRHREAALRPQHDIGRVQGARGRELASRRQVAGIALGGADGDPARDRGDLGGRHPPLAGEIPVAGNRLPRRHAPLLDRFENLVAAPVDVLVIGQRERRPATRPVTLLAMLLQQRRDVLAEGDRWRIGGGRANRDDTDKGEKKAPREHGVC